MEKEGDRRLPGWGEQGPTVAGLGLTPDEGVSNGGFKGTAYAGAVIE
jgi:hypothetical protein